MICWSYALLLSYYVICYYDVESAIITLRRRLRYADMRHDTLMAIRYDLPYLHRALRALLMLIARYDITVIIVMLIHAPAASCLRVELPAARDTLRYVIRGDYAASRYVRVCLLWRILIRTL